VLADDTTCDVLFDAGRVAAAGDYRRRDRTVHNFSTESAWTQYAAAVPQKRGTIASKFPVEQSELTLKTSTTQFAVYETELLDSGGELVLETSLANGVVVFVDGRFLGARDNRDHAEGKVNLTFGTVNGTALRVVSENFGFHNLIGRWGASRTRKRIGLFRAFLDGKPLTHWRSTPGPLVPGLELPQLSAAPCVFSDTTFDLPTDDDAVYVLDAGSLGRGHFWLNGHDLGRFWNVTRAGDTRPTQRHYHLPREWLRPTGNHLRIFDALGGDVSGLAIVRTATVPSLLPAMPDDVDSPASCLN